MSEADAQIAKQDALVNAPFIAVALTAFEWSRLLNELQWLMNLSGHELFAKEFFEKIGSQLNDKPITVNWIR